MRLGVRKSIIGTVMICLLIVNCGSVFISAADSESIMPLYKNTTSTISTMSINDNGLMTISYQYYGYPEITQKAIITTYIEKKVLGLFWTRVDIGITNDEWIDTINDYMYQGSRTFQLSSKGTYRVKISYEIYGLGGAADVITFKKADTY